LDRLALRIVGRNDDHRDIPDILILGFGGKHGKAIAAGHHQIQQQDIGMPLVQQGQCRFPILGL